MAKIVLDRYIKENKAPFTRIRLRIDKGKKPLSRKRSAEEKAILLELDRARWARWVEEGRIEFLGQRKFRVRLFT